MKEGLLPYQFKSGNSSLDEDTLEDFPLYIKKLKIRDLDGKLTDKVSFTGRVAQGEGSIYTTGELDAFQIEVNVTRPDEKQLFGTENLKLNLGDISSKKVFVDEAECVDSGESEPISIKGSSDCDENQYLFEVEGKSNGVVSFALTLGEDPLPEERVVQYSKDGGVQDPWKKYDPGALRRLSDEGSGYLKVQLLPQSAEGQSLNAKVMQHDIQFEGDKPGLMCNIRC